MRVFLLFFLVGYLGVMVVWFDRSPAFNTDLRVVAADGETVLQEPALMYDRSDYLVEIGRGYLFPEFELLSDLDALDVSMEIPSMSFEEARARVEQGILHLEQSVLIAPADARAWSFLAWGYAMNDQEAETVLEALQRSWRLAPFDRILAGQRLSLLASLLSEDEDVDELVLNASDLEAIERDKAILQKYEPVTLRDISDSAPEASVLSLSE